MSFAYQSPEFEMAGTVVDYLGVILPENRGLQKQKRRCKLATCNETKDQATECQAENKSNSTSCEGIFDARIFTPCNSCQQPVLAASFPAAETQSGQEVVKVHINPAFPAPPPGGGGDAFIDKVVFQEWLTKFFNNEIVKIGQSLG